MRRLLPICCGVFIVASVAIFLFGESGVLAYQSLDRYGESLAQNVQALKQHNQELNDQLQKLRSDRESNVVMARSIGLYEQDDAVVKLAGRSPGSEAYSMGDLLKMRKSDGNLNAALKAGAVAAAGLLLSFSFISGRLPRRKSNDPRRR